MPEISVIVPAYRPADFDRLLASMTANSDADAEWIVVDDGSGPDFDETFAVLDGTGARVIRQSQNCYQGAARNIGLAKARGEWIKFLDVDDELDSGHLTVLLNAAQEAQENKIVFAPTRHIFSDGRSFDNESWRDLEATPEAQLSRLLQAPFLHHCGALFPHDLLRQINGYEESLVTDEDGDLLFRVLMAGYSFIPVESVHYLYIQHQGEHRVSSDNSNAKLAARLSVCDRVEEAFVVVGQIMPQAVRHGLALRLDKIALSYWYADRAAARAILTRARVLCPNYRVPGRWSLRVLRALGGPDAVLVAKSLYKWLRARRRLKVGAQG